MADDGLAPYGATFLGTVTARTMIQCKVAIYQTSCKGTGYNGIVMDLLWT